jgi:cytochrome c oxidase subunit IV
MALMIWGLELKVWGLGFELCGLGFRVSGFKIWCLILRFKFRV